MGDFWSPRVSNGMAEHADWTLIARYLADELSAAERATVEAWLAEDPGRRAMLEQLRQGAERAGALGDLAAEWDVEFQWRRLHGAMPGPTTIPKAPRIAPAPDGVGAKDGAPTGRCMGSRCVRCCGSCDGYPCAASGSCGMARIRDRCWAAQECHAVRWYGIHVGTGQPVARAGRLRHG